MASDFNDISTIRGQNTEHSGVKYKHFQRHRSQILGYMHSFTGSYSKRCSNKTNQEKR